MSDLDKMIADVAEQVPRKLSDPYEAADALGLIVVLPGAAELFIDIDDAESMRVLDAMIVVMRQNGFDVQETRRTTSRSGNTHVTLSIVQPDGEPLNPITRILLQACLGSDRKREILSYCRIVRKVEQEPTTFFERED